MKKSISFSRHLLYNSNIGFVIGKVDTLKPVLVSVKSIQRNKEGEELKMELVSEGKFYVKDGTQYIVYEESELTEMKGVTTVIKVLPGGSVLLLRLGKLRQRQEFRKGKVTRSQYDTPVGTFDVQMKTYECRADLLDGVGTIQLGYDVHIEGVSANYTQLTITVQEDQA